MRCAKRFGWAVAIGLWSAGGLFAQTGSTGTGTTGTASTGTASSGGGGGTSSNTGALAVSQLGDPSNAPAAISGTAIGSTTSPSGVSQSNVLGSFYANPQFQGSAGATENTTPGGFGTPLYGSATTTGVATGSSRTVGTSTNSTRATGATTATTSGSTFTGLTSNATTAGGTTGRGGTTGFGTTGTANRTTGTSGFGASSQLVTNLLGTTTTNSLANAVGGQVVPLSRPIAYPAVMQFRVAVTPPAVVQTNLQTMIDTSSQIASRGGVQVTTEAGGLVVLRGAVRDEDEARTAEGMVRLTPGIRDVRNELTYPKPTVTP